MENLTPQVIVAALLAIASAVVLLSNAAEKIVLAWKAAKAPNVKQDERIAALEKWKETVDEKLDKDNDRLDDLKEGNYITQQALLALLDHGIDGNNIKQMQDAKVALYNHLTHK